MRHRGSLLSTLLIFGVAGSAAEPPPSWPSDPPLPGLPVEGWPGLGAEEPGEALGTEDAVEAVLARHPELGALASELAAARSSRSAASFVPGPSFELHAVPKAEGVDVELAAGVDVLALSLAPARRAAATAVLDAEEARTRAEGLRLAFRVREGVVAAQAAASRRRLLEASFDAQAASRDVARALYEAGNVRALDVATQEAAYEMLRQQVAGARADAAVARRPVEAWLARGGAWHLADLAPAPVDFVPPSDAEALAVAASLELAELRARALSARRGAGVAVAERAVPSLQLGPYAAWEGTDPGVVGLAASGRLPLFGVGVAAGRVRSREADAADARAEQLALDVAAAARAAVDAAVVAHARSRHLDTVVVPLHDRVLRETLLQYNAMQIGAWPLVAALRARLDAAVAAVDARQAWAVAEARLQALLDGVRVEAARAPFSPGMALPSVGGGH